MEFDLEQLIQVAVDVCEEAQSCSKVTKGADGLHNKAFILTMDNGCEVLAKLPNPNAGPISDMFAMEPLATGELWNGVRKYINLDRGLCKSRESTEKDLSDYTHSLGRNEVASVTSHATP
ncbi:Aminoglycoside phosphotransferase [Penicillium robsamsonii]|uniref:Aminoglycoside phosphotransferase n=1 Tax=Penicillium robsamsonii TaxID=1792511 RepID=UPI002547F26D|nr:Aminoglycoside phosphotransferase [Penicillium robsamsonii]KAJ5826930.1 Aminoglycoside phosphotransferase [Penicillium robsamsonii]